MCIKYIEINLLFHNTHNQFMFITFYSRIKEPQCKISTKGPGEWKSTHVISMVDSNC